MISHVIKTSFPSHTLMSSLPDPSPSPYEHHQNFTWRTLHGALSLCPPQQISTSWGSPGSCQSHLHPACARGELQRCSKSSTHPLSGRGSPPVHVGSPPITCRCMGTERWRGSPQPSRTCPPTHGGPVGSSAMYLPRGRVTICT